MGGSLCVVGGSLCGVQQDRSRSKLESQLVLVVSRLHHISCSEMTRQTLTQSDKVQNQAFFHGHGVV